MNSSKFSIKIRIKSFFQFAQTQNQVQMFSSAGGFQGVPQVTEADRQRFLELERQKMQQYEQERRMNAQGGRNIPTIVQAVRIYKIKITETFARL